MIHNSKHLTYSYFFLFLSSVLLLQGVKDFSVPVGLDAKVKVDLVVVGSVAVSGKGDCLVGISINESPPQHTNSVKYREPKDTANLPF